MYLSIQKKWLARCKYALFGVICSLHRRCAIYLLYEINVHMIAGVRSNPEVISMIGDMLLVR